MSGLSICRQGSQRGLDVEAGGPGLDQRAVAHRHHQLVPQPRLELLQAEERDDEHDEADDAADAVLVGQKCRVVTSVRIVMADDP